MCTLEIVIHADVLLISETNIKRLKLSLSYSGTCKIIVQKCLNIQVIEISEFKNFIGKIFLTNIRIIPLESLSRSAQELTFLHSLMFIVQVNSVTCLFWD